MINSMINTCCFCSKPIKSYRKDVDTCIFHIECPICGYYKITEGAIDHTDFSQIPQYDLVLFSGLLHNSAFSKIIDVKTCENISEIVLPLKNITVPEKVNNILKYIYGNATKVSGEIEITENDVYSFYLDASDFKDIMEHLEIRKLIKSHQRDNNFSCVLTIEGWEKYEQIKKEIANRDSKQVFVAMSFNKDLKKFYDNAIKPAAKKCGYDALRVDSREHNEKICDRIIGEINKSRFVIADFTENKHGVYFEAGYALGLNIPVIWTCKEQEVNNLHFDTRQYNHITWKNAKDFKEKLIDRINSTIKMNLK